MKKQLFFFLALLVAFPFRCAFDFTPPPVKNYPQDPFAKTMAPSQMFRINANEDNVVEGGGGTLIVFPKGCFKDAKGRTVTDSVRVELAEAFAVEDMLLSNLTTTSGGKLLETGGMIYINAFSGEEPLRIDDDNPILIEIPTKERIPGMMAYRGIRDKEGNMDWVEPEELDNSLTTLDFSLLDFLPKGFEKAVEENRTDAYEKQGTPFADSLYYSLSTKEMGDSLIIVNDLDVTEENFRESKLVRPVSWSISGKEVGDNEYLLTFTAKIDKGWHIFSQNLANDDGPIPTAFFYEEGQGEFFGNKSESDLLEGFEVFAHDESSAYAINGFNDFFQMDLLRYENKVSFTQKVRPADASKPIKGFVEYMVCDKEKCLPPTELEFAIDLEGTCGINPASIKAIKSPEYQNTLIATRQFEERLRVIFATCKQDVLDLYINNLDKDMKELDALAADMLEGDFGRRFERFAAEGHGNVRDADKYAALLKGHYEERLRGIEEELRTAERRAEEAVREKEAAAEQLIKEYKGVLKKRQESRMEIYRFKWSDTGWINVDVPVERPEEGVAAAFERRPKPSVHISVEGYEKYDRIYTYLLYKDIKSLYRLAEKGGGDFGLGGAASMAYQRMSVGGVVVVAVAYKGENVHFAKVDGYVPNLAFSLALLPSTLGAVRQAVAQYDDYGQENSLDAELDYMEAFEKERKRRQKLREDWLFLRRLMDLAYPCCVAETEGG